LSTKERNSKERTWLTEAYAIFNHRLFHYDGLGDRKAGKQIRVKRGKIRTGQSSRPGCKAIKRARQQMDHEQREWEREGGNLGGSVTSVIEAENEKRKEVDKRGGDIWDKKGGTLGGKMNWKWPENPWGLYAPWAEPGSRDVEERFHGHEARVGTAACRRGVETEHGELIFVGSKRSETG